MKKTFIIIATMFAFLSAHAQVNHIISTIYETDYCNQFSVVSTDTVDDGFLMPVYDTLELDLNQDGNWDVLFHAVFHPLGNVDTPTVDMYFPQDWDFYVEYPNLDSVPIIVDTVLVDTMIIDENLHWYHYSNILFSSPWGNSPFYCFRHRAEDGAHYCWAHLSGKYPRRVCVRSMGYCTLPDTPIRWGQTELWGVEENGAEGFATLHPNPTTGMVTVKGENLRQAFVTNLLGQQVLSVQGEGDELQIDMTALPAGVYFVTVIDRNGRKCVRKAVRE